MAVEIHVRDIIQVIGAAGHLLSINNVEDYLFWRLDALARLYPFQTVALFGQVLLTSGYELGYLSRCLPSLYWADPANRADVPAMW